MQNLHEFDDRLMNMLAEHTQKLTNTFKHFAENDAVYTECKQLILAIAAELARRKKANPIDLPAALSGQSTPAQDK